MSPSPTAPPGLTILFADDNQELIQMYKDYFGGRGYTVLAARDGHELVRAVIFSDVDVVITDINMPRVDGALAIEVLHIVAPDLPVIALSDELGHGEGPADLAGMCAVLRKPTKLSRLETAIREAAGQADSGASMPPAAARANDATRASDAIEAFALEADRETGGRSFHDAVDLQIEVQHSTGLHCTLRLTGDLDLQTSRALARTFQELLSQRNRHVKIDLLGVDRIDSSALGLLASMVMTLEQRGGNLHFTNPGKHASKILRLLGVVANGHETHNGT